MKLRELIVGAGLDPSGASDVEITGLAYSDASVTEGTLFFCVQGMHSDGHDFAPRAMELGAAALVCQKRLDLDLPQIVVENVRAAMGPTAAAFFGRPSRDLVMVGVTGTNGKTTTSFLVRHILDRHGMQSGLLGTVLSIVGGERREVERTTPEAIDLQRTLREMAAGGDQACVMEVSSHALELRRSDAIEFDCVVFTNLTQDHLDFHGTLDRYFGAKRSLFVQPPASRPFTSIINLDDEWGRRLAAEVAEVGQTHLVTFAVENDADYRADAIEVEVGGTSFELTTPEGVVSVEIPLPGVFNVYNATAAIAACHGLGVPVAKSAAMLSDAATVPGRFEQIDEGQKFTVLVDYAHSPDSLENVLYGACDLLDGGRLICVFGAGGDRDRDKRPMMGEVAHRLCDHVIVTSDNPRSERPDEIIDQIVSGARRASSADSACVLEIEPDRRAAIRRAVGEARPGDIVLIAGKGHEQGQELAGGRKIPFDDRQVVREELHELREGASQ
ncbi:MAG: UDP-N-acetylmuramoyl-L-alanyl-D-glutamate--2,6-diaminopimelate ligase [Solirubrobacterales bacterium]